MRETAMPTSPPKLLSWMKPCKEHAIIAWNLKSSVTLYVHVSSTFFLWSGEFGIVYKGYIVEDTTTDIVAIKTLKGRIIIIARFYNNL